jgi:hypothetical protein
MKFGRAVNERNEPSLSLGVVIFLVIVVCGFAGAIVGLFVGAATCDPDLIVGCLGDDSIGAVWGAVGGEIVGLVGLVVGAWLRIERP